MASGVVKIEGKEISLDQEIIDAGIPAIRAALSVDFPAVENADIQIVSGSGGAPRVATVVKRGTGKGIVRLSSSRGLPPVKGGDVKSHLQRNARESIDSLMRRLEGTRSQQVVLNLARTECACGSEQPHPDQWWIILVGGPFANQEEALNGLNDVAVTKEDVMKHDAIIRRRFTGSDITGGGS